jgi:hypothetical protein
MKGAGGVLAAGPFFLGGEYGREAQALPLQTLPVSGFVG